MTRPSVATEVDWHRDPTPTWKTVTVPASTAIGSSSSSTNIIVSPSSQLPAHSLDPAASFTPSDLPMAGDWPSAHVIRVSSLDPTRSVLGARSATTTSQASHLPKSSSSPSSGNTVEATTSQPSMFPTDRPVVTHNKFLLAELPPLEHPVRPAGVPDFFLDRFVEAANRHRAQTSHLNPSRQLLPNTDLASTPEKALVADKPFTRFREGFRGRYDALVAQGKLPSYELLEDASPEERQQVAKKRFSDFLKYLGVEEGKHSD